MSVPAAVRSSEPEVEAGVPGHPWRACAALTRVEAVRLLRHPAVLVGILAYLVPWFYSWTTQGERGHFPVLQDADRGTQIRLLPLALATLLAANLAVLRPSRDGAEALFDVLVLPARHRAAAMLAALVPAGLVAAVLVAARMVALETQSGAAGRPNAFELACGPSMVVLLGAVGVLLGYLVRSAAAAPLGLVALVVMILAAMLPGRLADSSARWLLPLASEMEGSPPLPVNLLGRPAGWHLVYLAGLLVLLVVAVMAANQVRGVALGGVTVAGLVLTLVAGTLQVRPLSDGLVAARVAATESPASQQTCEHRDQVTYCAFPDFTPQIAGWEEVVHGILRRTPPAAAKRQWVVRQRVQAAGGVAAGGGVGQPPPLAQWQEDDLRHGTPNPIPVATSWNEGESVIEFAGRFAYQVMAGTPLPADGYNLCEARGALMIWLAGQATPRSRTALHGLVAGSSGGVSITAAGFGSGVYVSDRPLALGLRMLAQPVDEMADRVRRSWPELTAPGTSFDRVGSLLGVDVPPAEQDGICP